MTPSQFKQANQFPNSVSLTIVHNKFISGPARQNKIKTCQKKLKYIYSRHKNTFKTTSDQNNRERSVQQQNSDLICIFRTIMVKKQ